MSRLLPRYTVTGKADQLKVDKAVGNANHADIVVHTKTKPTAGGDSRKLRGIPVVGGVSGTSPGTDPLAALIAKENQRERR